jgi:hypothetical protein
MNAVIASFFICLLALTSPDGFSQEKDTVLLTPGHSLLKGHRLKTGRSSFTFLLTKDGQQQKVGGLQEDLQVVSVDHVQSYLRICQISFGANKILDSGLAAVGSLLPVYHRSFQTKKVMRFDFSPGMVAGTITNLDSTGERIEPVRHPVTLALFDSYYEDIIARCLSFKKGLVFKFPEYIYERGGEVWSTGEIIGPQKKQDGKGRAVDAWEIRFYEHDGKGAIVRQTTYFISAKDRNILSREYKMGSTILLMAPEV